MQNIFSIDDCPLLDDVDFLQHKEDDEENDENEYESEKTHKQDDGYLKMSPSELGLIYISTRKDTDFTKLYNVIKKTLYKNVIKVVGKNRDDIETVIDMTMMYVYLNIDKYDVNKSNFCAWVHGIAKNTALNHINRFGHNNPNMHSTDFSEFSKSLKGMNEVITVKNKINITDKSVLIKNQDEIPFAKTSSAKISSGEFGSKRDKFKSVCTKL